MFFFKSPKEKAQYDLQVLLEDLHTIETYTDKMELLRNHLWDTLAPLHDINSSDDVPRVMRRLWRAALIKSLYGLGRVGNRLPEFACVGNKAFESLPPEGIGLIEFLLNDKADTFAAAVTRAEVGMRHDTVYRITAFQEQYPDLFPVQ